ncbi:MAG: glycosyltransferase family 4 protein [Alphaproteobacteria bacterium]|nr:glycosyltransferase family 4 protein [Alphaproteobacteria bacterium]
MRIAFYAPLKSPDHAVPSGDRTVARLFLCALREAGHSVQIASRLRTFDDAGDDARQERRRGTAERSADRYIARHRAAPPDLWFTYHLYHKAPDWIGPRVASALGIPYVVAEASYAPKQTGGPWAVGHEAVAAALRATDRIICLNPADEDCIAGLLGSDDRIRRLVPFLDTGPARRAAARRKSLRTGLAGALGIDRRRPWIAVTAMMRPGDKLASYRLLGRALKQVEARPWVLLVAGDGEARAEVEQALDFPGRVRYLGGMDRKAIDSLHAAADIGVWPAINEAYGMALLEAQAAGLPLVAGDRPGVRQIVIDGETGFLAPEGDATALADAMGRLMDDPDLIAEMRETALKIIDDKHNLMSAAKTLDRILREAAAATGKSV